MRKWLMSRICVNAKRGIWNAEYSNSAWRVDDYSISAKKQWMAVTMVRDTV